MSVTLICVRHGETSSNAGGILQGRLDVPLNAVGRAQAQAAASALAASLPRHCVHAVVCSDLSRAHETARVIASALDAPLIPDERLRETFLGEWEGMAWVEVQRTRPHEVSRRSADPDYSAGGGETMRARLARVAVAIHSAALRGVVAPPRKGSLGEAHTSSGAGASGAPPPASPAAAARCASAASSHAVIVVVAHGGVLDDVGRLVLDVPFGKATGLSKRNAALSTLSFTPSERTQRGLVGDDIDCNALIVAALPPPQSVTPAAASTALGRWECVAWGEDAHIAAMGAGGGEWGKDALLRAEEEAVGGGGVP